jgi:hypothetical protein
VGLERRSEAVDVEGGRIRVKIVDRPGGRTAKADSDDVLAHGGHARRAALHRRAESAALGAAPPGAAPPEAEPSEAEPSEADHA